MNRRGRAMLLAATLVAHGVAAAAAAFDFGSLKTDAQTDAWLRSHSATYAGGAADITSRTDVRGYRFADDESVRRGMVVVRDGYLEIQMNPALAGAERVNTLIFEVANASRHRDHEQIDYAADEGVIRTAEEFGLAHEMVEYEALRDHRRVLTEIEPVAGQLPPAFFYFVTPTARSTADYHLPGLRYYLQAQQESGHTEHYYRLYRERMAKRPTAVAAPAAAGEPAAPPP